jgi:hypothetical protein
MYYYVMNSDEIMHSGILGMKWGIRRYQNKDGSLTPAGRARYAKLARKLERTRNEKKRAKYQKEMEDLDGTTKRKKEEAKKQKELEKQQKAEEERKKDIRNWTDEELQTALNRMDMEKRYYDSFNNKLKYQAEVADRLKTPEQRKAEEKALRKEKFKQDLINTLQTTGLDVLKKSANKITENALNSLFDDAEKKAKEKNGDNKKDGNKDNKNNEGRSAEQLKQAKLKTEEAKLKAEQSKRDAQRDKMKLKEEKREARDNRKSDREEKKAEREQKKADREAEQARKEEEYREKKMRQAEEDDAFRYYSKQSESNNIYDVPYRDVAISSSTSAGRIAAQEILALPESSSARRWDDYWED